MKKLNLRALEFGAKEVLTREQLKQVLGGDDGSAGVSKCSVVCKDGKEKEKDCGIGVSCSTSGTLIYCGTAGGVEMC